MTLGQRIAQKRKELDLSQEGLGEQLKVSRQAIYKWESDATLPEIDKLITLSRIFSVSVGWLLGVEEAPCPQGEDSGELSEAQLAMVQEIVDRYLAAQPQPAPRKKRWYVKFCAGLALFALVVALFNLFYKLDRVAQDYDNLRYSVDNVNNTVDRQINSITRRVEDILKSQNALTAEWSAELVSTDLQANTATFDVRIVPRTYVEGMTAIFQARSEDEMVELAVGPGADHAFTGQITCPLTDDISLTAVFLTGDKRETQWLENYSFLYTETFPSLHLDGSLWHRVVFEDGETVTLEVSGQHGAVTVRHESIGGRGWKPNPPDKLQVGLFRDNKLVCWYEGKNQISTMNGVQTEEYAWFRSQEVVLEAGHTYIEAAVYTDEYGRQMVYTDVPVVYNRSEMGWGTPNSYAVNGDPASWEF